jgi:hypothetical protein
MSNSISQMSFDFDSLIDQPFELPHQILQAHQRKQCSKCKKIKDISEFSKHTRTKGGLKYECKECANYRAKAHYRESILKHHKDKRKRKYINLNSKYGVEENIYEEILREQDGKCAICGNRETAKHHNGEVKSLAVDHNHDTGEIRGLLCQKCNVGLGHFKDNPTLLQNAIAYLQANES